MKKIKKLEVERIEVFPAGTVPVTPIIDRQGYELTANMKASEGYYLPRWEDLLKKGWGVDSLRTTDKYFEVIVIGKINGRNFRLYSKFDPSWITDLASVPRIFRSLIDNDAQWLIAASQVHDGLFVLQGSAMFDFWGTNRLFREMCILELSRRNKSTLKAWLAYIAVCSPVGWRRWKMKRDTWEKQGVKFEKELR